MTKLRVLLLALLGIVALMGASPTVTSSVATALRLSDGTALQVGAVSDGQGLIRSGTSIVGATVPWYTTTAVSGAGTAACNTWYRINTGAGFTHTLPTASNGCMICWKKDNDTDAVILARAGSDTIDGATSITLDLAYQQLCLWGRTSGWDVY